MSGVITYIHTYITLHYTSPHFTTLNYIHSYIHTYVRTYIHTYVRTYIHTYIHNTICKSRMKMITSQGGRAVTASNQRVHWITSLNVKCKSNRYHAFFIALLYERPRASADMYGGTESTTPATQIVVKLPRTSMEGTESTTPATQIEAAWMNGAGCICLRWLSCKICILHVIYKFCTYMVQPGCNPCNQHVLI